MKSDADKYADQQVHRPTKPQEPDYGNIELDPASLEARMNDFQIVK